jgi:hypothetical protein
MSHRAVLPRWQSSRSLNDSFTALAPYKCIMAPFQGLRYAMFPFEGRFGDRKAGSKASLLSERGFTVSTTTPIFSQGEESDYLKQIISLKED